jgi:hypothetical protein
MSKPQDLYPGATSSDVSAMTEAQEIAAGRSLAYGLKLRRDKEHRDRWQTNWGSKTDLGLWRTVQRMIHDIECEHATLSRPLPQSHILR